MTILIDYWFVSKLVANRIGAFVPPYHTKTFRRPDLATLDWSKDCGAKNDFETTWNWILVSFDPSLNGNHLFNTWEKIFYFWNHRINVTPRRTPFNVYYTMMVPIFSIYCYTHVHWDFFISDIIIFQNDIIFTCHKLFNE